MINEGIEEALSHEIYNKRRLSVGNVTANTRAGDLDDEDFADYDAIEPGLPTASSDRRKWWLDNGTDSENYRTICSANGARPPCSI